MMTLKNALFVACLTAVLVACGKKEEAAAPAEQAPAATAAPAATEAPAATAAAADLPTECTEYFAKVEACVAKAGAAADSFKQAMEQAKTQFSSMTAEQKGAAAESCKQGAAAFAQAAAALKC